jgi:hypothetical protein
MTELQLYKFISDNEIEWHWNENDAKQDVILFVNTYHIDDFLELIRSATDDEGIECRLKDGYLCFWIRDICEYYDVEMENVFITKES